MSTIKPRRTIAYHALLDKGTEQDNLYYDSIRESYDGTLFIRSDMMAWNVMKDEITERMAVATGNAWGVPGTTRQPPPPQPGVPDTMSDFIKNGEWGPGFNAQNRMLDEHAERYNLQEQDWRLKKPWYEKDKD